MGIKAEHPQKGGPMVRIDAGDLTASGSDLRRMWHIIEPAGKHYRT